jgi:hypothetical protein
MADDPLIAQKEEEARRSARAANLFDIRRFIGALFLIYGLILTVLGIGASDAEIEKAADINVNLWTGLAMLVVAALFLAWAFMHPMGEELAERESESTGAGAGPDSDRPGGGDRPGSEQA